MAEEAVVQEVNEIMEVQAIEQIQEGTEENQ
jgi:hypothetical protein